MLESGKLSYFEDEGGKMKGSVRFSPLCSRIPGLLPCCMILVGACTCCALTQVDLFGSKFEFLAQTDHDRPFCGKITPLAGEELIICADTRVDLHVRWCLSAARRHVTREGAVITVAACFPPVA